MSISGVSGIGYGNYGNYGGYVDSYKAEYLYPTYKYVPQVKPDEKQKQDILKAWEHFLKEL